MGDPMWEIESPWRGTGGHIAFLDGHVAWYGSLDPTVNDGMSLSAYPTRQDASGAVMDISLALPSETVIRILDPDTDD